MCISNSLNISFDRVRFDRQNFATATRYNFTTTTVKRISVPKGCELIQIYVYNRHGANNPNIELSTRLEKALPRLKNHILSSAETGKINLCQNVKRRLENWHPSIFENNSNELSDTGRRDSLEMGKRFLERYPELLTKLSMKDLKISHTERIWTKIGAKYFVKGLLHLEHLPNLNLEPNPILRFYKICDQKLMLGDWTPKEWYKFADGPIVQATLETISKQLGFRVTLDDGVVMYTVCAHEVVFHGSSVWCSFLSETDTKVFEYLDDLMYYYNDGYARERNYKQACPVVRDIMQTFRDAIRKEVFPKAVLMFSHGRSFKKLCSMFSILKDVVAPMADNFCCETPPKYKSSLIAPFNANLAFALYKCEQGSQFMVETRLNENPVAVKGCPATMCDFNTFSDAFRVDELNCDLDKICKRNEDDYS